MRPRWRTTGRHSRSASARRRRRRPVAQQAVGRGAGASSCTTESGSRARPVSRANEAMSRFCRIGPLAASANSNSRDGAGATIPSTATMPAGVVERRQRGARGEVARRPAALDQHDAAAGLERERRDDEEADLAVHLAVVEEDGALGEPAAAQADAAMVLRLGGTRRARQRRRVERGLARARLEARLQGDLLRGAVELPEAEPRASATPASVASSVTTSAPAHAATARSTARCGVHEGPSPSRRCRRP